jgi:TPR repeat protein
MASSVSSLADLPELVGFFSYAREDDEDFRGALSALRDRIQKELRAQLGRSAKTLRLWQDRDAIAAGTLWQTEITGAVTESVFFIPIVTPRAVKSPYCKFELDAFLAREKALARSDLVFPILYINVPALLDDRSKADPVLSIIAERQFLDWRELRHRGIESTEVLTAIERFCADITTALEGARVALGERNTKAETAEERQRRKDEAEELFKRGFKFDTGTGGLPKDEKEAARLYKLAAAQGNASAQINLGVMYEDGSGGLPRDDEEAVRLYRLAAEQGHARGQTNLAIMYERGRGGLARDDEEAVRLYRLAVDQGDTLGQTNLGVMYEQGRGGLPKDDREAVRLYKLAAEQGKALGQAYLGDMYEKGRGGLPKDEKEAVRLYRLAAEQGNDFAKKALARLGGGSSGLLGFFSRWLSS